MSNVVCQVPSWMVWAVALAGISGVLLSRLLANHTSVVALAGSLLPTGMTRSWMSAALFTKVWPPTVCAIQPCTRCPSAGFTSRPSWSRPKAPLRV